MKAWHNQHINNGEAEMAKTQILHRYTGAVLFECEVPAEHSGMAVRYALEKAVADGASLVGASLDGASLDGASLDGASLRCASLVGASLDGASLDGATLVGASLDGASLDGASLRCASLEGATLDGASLDGASLRCASLDGASLDGATLDGASLDGASLRSASLDGASLRSASLDGEILTRTPRSINHTTWPILITEGYMRIGCQRHTHAEWAAFDDDAIARMESRAPAFWDQWREPLMAMCKAHANIN
jgi:hypothetical protein